MSEFSVKRDFFYFSINSPSMLFISYNMEFKQILELADRGS